MRKGSIVQLAYTVGPMFFRFPKKAKGSLIRFTKIGNKILVMIHSCTQFQNLKYRKGLILLQNGINGYPKEHLNYSASILIGSITIRWCLILSTYKKLKTQGMEYPAPYVLNTIRRNTQAYKSYAKEKKFPNLFHHINPKLH